MQMDPDSLTVESWNSRARQGLVRFSPSVDQQLPLEVPTRKQLRSARARLREACLSDPYWTKRLEEEGEALLDSQLASGIFAQIPRSERCSFRVGSDGILVQVSGPPADLEE